MLLPAYDITFYEFDEEQDPKSYGVLLCDVVHGKPPLTPLYIAVGWYWYYHGFRSAAETLHLPTTKGWDSRFIKGYPYITAIRTTTEEAKEREPIFRQKIKPFIEDFEKVWQMEKTKLMNMYQESKESRGLTEWKDIKKLSNIELLHFFLDYIFDINRKEGEIHMIFMMSSYYISGLFQQMWREMFGKEPSVDSSFQTLMTGFDSQLFRVDKELWRLAHQAKKLALGQAFQATEDNEQLLMGLNESEAGRKWLKDYYEFLKKHGWRCERMQEYRTPCWLEKPSLGIPSIKTLMAKESYTLDEERERLVRQREEAEKEIVSKVPVEQREWFRHLMKAAQHGGYWSEDHTYYCDFYIAAIGRWIAIEFGRRFAETGSIDNPEDIVFLLPDDIRKAAIPMGRVNLRPYVERRKKAWQENLTIEPPPFYGDISQAQDVLRSDPTLSAASQVPIVREELKADLYGTAAAPGVVEGIARVIIEVDKIAELKPGEILVAPGTSPAWMSAFSVISGIITDGGGMMSHALIIAREYGIPGVVGCLEGTTKIKTGQRVKIDGNLGVVHILD